jgi:hypothetical protein
LREESAVVVYETCGHSNDGLFEVRRVWKKFIWRGETHAWWNVRTADCGTGCWDDAGYYASDAPWAYSKGFLDHCGLFNISNEFSMKYEVKF